MREVNNGGSQIRKVIIGAVAFGLALVSGAAVAQIQGPAAPNYGVGGPQTGGETGGTSNTQRAQPRNPNTGQGTLYNYALGQGINQGPSQHRRGTTGYTR
jgi:hypothetical protein